MSYVYFILDEKSNAIKIGKANNIDERLSDLQTGNSNELRVEYFIECKNEEHSFYLEKNFHKQFEHLHQKGEWFRYELGLIDFIKNSPLKFPSKEKRQTLKIATLFGEKKLFDVKNNPTCYFYSYLSAQIMHNYEEASKLKIPFRTMEWPTYGKSLLLPFSDKKNRVFISTKKHEENMEQNRFQKVKNKTSSLESFFG